jgi:protein-S-isoprenylcysteine O-methyltransferase Ste14
MSLLLVLLQFVLIAAIAFPFAAPAPSLPGILLFACGIAVFFLALAAMRMKTFTVMPEPKAGGELVTAGIYGVVRHPMYLAVLLCAAGAALAYGSPWKWALAAVLAAVLVFKLRREERMLAARYPGYAEYRRHTRALIPFLL